MKTLKLLFSNLETTLLTIFLMFFSFGQLQRLQLTGQIAFYLTDLVIVCFLLLKLSKEKNQLSFSKIKTISKKIKTTFGLELIWLVWLCFGVLLGSIAGNITNQSLLYLLRLIVYSSFIVSLAKTKTIAYSPRAGFSLTVLLMMVWGIIQYLLIPDTRFLAIFGWDNHYFRLIGTLFDPAFMGMLLVLGFGWWQSPKLFSFLPIAWKSLIQLLFIATIAATFSRASFIALSVLLVGLLISKQLKLKFITLVALVFTATLILLPKPGGEGVNLARTSTAQARGLNIQESLQLTGGEWLWGRGIFNDDRQQPYETPNHAKLPDSLPVMIVNATGLGGLVLAGLVLNKWWWRWWSADPLWTSLLLATLVHSLFNNTLLQPFIFLSLWGSQRK